MSIIVLGIYVIKAAAFNSYHELKAADQNGKVTKILNFKYF